jgi:carbon storage regulator
VLIIRRRRGESIVIGDDIRIEILETSPTQVKLGIAAPKDVSVLRSEICITRDANLAASAPAADPGKLTRLVETLRESPAPAEPAAPSASAAPGDSEQ